MKKLVILLLILPLSVLASDLAKEKRWADQVVDGILDGEAVWLNDGSHDFLSIHTLAKENKKRAAIVIHGTGIHPDWQQVVQPVRVGLTEQNWNTLSIQMPVLPNEAEYAEYEPLYVEVAPRINAAIKYAKEAGNEKIVLIGHSQGAAMAAYYLASSQNTVDGFVAIGIGSWPAKAVMNSTVHLEKITVPVFDLYGSEDLEQIMAESPRRMMAAKKAGNKNYTQKQLTGNHFFDDQDDALVETVANWLDTVK